jgi:hypothetical protein
MGGGADRTVSALESWFDPEMLRSIVGRDLLMIAGSEQARYVFLELIGRDRSWQNVWHDSANPSLWWPDIQHPIGSIDARIPAAQLAGLI